MSTEVLDRQACRRMTTQNHSIPPRVLAIIQSIALGHGVTVEDITPAKRGPRKITDARKAAMRACRSLVWVGGKQPSYPQIGRWFAVDHTAIMYACRGMVAA
jgi:chromosomal replication initiation ATPase DnaA